MSYTLIHNGTLIDGHGGPLSGLAGSGRDGRDGETGRCHHHRD